MGDSTFDDDPFSDERIREHFPRGSRSAETALHSRPAAPLLGVLPLRRLIPQDVHSVLDYAGALSFLGSAYVSRSRRARVAGAAIGSASAAVSLMTDYRLSVMKLIPIEVHEALDYVVAAAAIAAPFALGYARRDRLSTWFAVASGLSIAAVSMLTDYRAAHGVSVPPGNVEAA